MLSVLDSFADALPRGRHQGMGAQALQSTPVPGGAGPHPNTVL